MQMVVEASEVATPGANSPHTSYALERLEIARELTAFRALIQGRKATSVMELFGGSGWHSAAIQDILAPKVHVVKDIAQSCVDSIKLSLPEVDVSQGDSYAFARDGFGGANFDLIHADFNQFTPMRNFREKLYNGVLRQIFNHSKWAIVTDSAVFGVARFAKNREAYSNYFGKPIKNVRDYYKAVDDWYGGHYQRRIQSVVIWSNMSSAYILAPGAAKDFPISSDHSPAEIRILEG